MELFKALWRVLFFRSIKEGQVYEFVDFESNPFEKATWKVKILDYQKEYVKYKWTSSNNEYSLDRSSFIFMYKLVKD